MKIAIIGAGAIGGLVAGYLKLKGQDVSLVGSPESARAIQQEGLRISGVRGDFKVDIDIQEHLKQPVDLAILCVKTQDLEKALKDNLVFLKESLILTTQNGVAAESITSRFVRQEKIISSIVMFGSTYLEPGKILHNFEGSWIIESKGRQLENILGQAFNLVFSDDIHGMKYLKVFVNANNCLPAILGVSMQEAFADPKISCISIAIWKEGLEIINQAGVKLFSLPDFPLERLHKLTSLPLAEAAKIYSGIILNLSKGPLYGSVLQSIKRGRSSEIDYINGEFVRLSRGNAPLNAKLVQMVHAVEKSGKFFSRQELLAATEGLYN